MGILAKHKSIPKKVKKVKNFINRLIERYIDYLNRKYKT